MQENSTEPTSKISGIVTASPTAQWFYQPLITLNNTNKGNKLRMAGKSCSVSQELLLTTDYQDLYNQAPGQVRGRMGDGVS